MATNDIGRVTPIWRGFYSAATTYELNDIVIDTAGSVWWHKSEELTTGVIPEAGEIWDAVIDMSVFSALIQAAITTAQTAVQAAQEAETGVAEDVQRAETAAQSAEASAAAASESAAGVGAYAQAAAESATAAAGSATEAAGSADAAAASATASAGSADEAESWATGGSGGTATATNNAKYYSEQSASSATSSASSAAAAQAVKDSIPDDYTTLSNDVGDLKTQLNDTNKTASNAYVSGNATGIVITTTDAQDTSPVKSEIIDIVPKQDGTGTPSSENVRAIIGYDAINVYRTGRNLWGGLIFAEAFHGKTTGYTLDTTAKTFTYVRRATGSGYATVISSGFKPNTRYTILITASASSRNTSLLVEYTDGSTKTTIDIDQTTKKTYRFVTNADKTVNRIMLGYVATGTVTVYYDETGIFEGEVSTDDFENYIGETVGHTLGSTVYGGRLNLLTGELEKISGYIASYNGEILVGPWISSMDVYAVGSTPTTGAQVFDFGAAKSTDNLTPKSFTMISGECNVWADCGLVQIEYLKNTKEYIDTQDEKLYERVISEIKPTVVDNIILNDSLSATSHDVFSVLDDIPVYWKNPEDEPTTYAEAIGYIEQKIETIPSGKHFLFVTDAHVEGDLNAGHSNFLMNYIKKRIGANKVLFGGDAVAQAQNKYYYAKKLSEYLFEARRMFGSSYLPTYGDHDTNLGNSIVTEENKSAMYLPYSEGYKIFFGDLKGDYHWMNVVEKFNHFLSEYSISYTEADYNDVIGFFKSVYYLDDDIDKIRYITLNCGQASAHYGGVYNIFGVEQIDVLRIQFDWFVDVLKSVPAGYDVVVLSHKASNMNSTAGNIINKMLSYYKQKGSYQPWPPEVGTNVDKWWYYKTIYDFSDAPDVGIVLQICGHRHFDMLRYTGMDSEDETTMVLSGEVENGGTLNQSQEYGQILQITTQTDSCGSVDSPDAYPMTLGTTTEQCFDVVTICPDKVVITRIGAGVDRVVNITFAT